MSKQSESKAKLQQGLLSTLSGNINNLVVTKSGVIYFKKSIAKKKKTI